VIERFAYKKTAGGYLVQLGGQLLGYVWATTSGAVWGSLSCTPDRRVWAYARTVEAMLDRKAQDTKGSRVEAARALKRLYYRD